MGQGMNDRRLALASDYDAGALVVFQLLDDRRQPNVAHPMHDARSSAIELNSHSAGDRTSELLDFAGAEWEPVIRVGPRQAGRALHDVQAVHLPAVCRHAPAIDELSRVAQ